MVAATGAIGTGPTRAKPVHCAAKNVVAGPDQSQVYSAAQGRFAP